MYAGVLELYVNDCRCYHNSICKFTQFPAIPRDVRVWNVYFTVRHREMRRNRRYRVVKTMIIEPDVCRERRLSVRESDIVRQTDIRRLPPRCVRRANLPNPLHRIR